MTIDLVLLSEIAYFIFAFVWTGWVLLLGYKQYNFSRTHELFKYKGGKETLISLIFSYISVGLFVWLNFFDMVQPKERLLFFAGLGILFFVLYYVFQEINTKEYLKHLKEKNK